MSVEREIRELIAQQSGVPLLRIHRDSRIAEDLGVSGTDAVDLFSRISGRYKVDLTLLWKRWDRHFLAGGIAVRGYVLIFAILAATAFLAFWLGDTLHLGDAGAILLWAMFAAMALAPLRHALPRRKPVPIRVQEITEAVARGRWQ
ncbi:acyl carrier protein [Stakelama tenebrarum]|uniref:Acyl carrier protein n=1 Tax=Stakelama tenebrarum TaxID=2711215 RepID=A0A6G6Y554_9SPHN|nr:acyl carrier protein [Sphingosinithalassobacter tenebrarum]QIG80029.1 acyl carrier protein [Sphingosinithalassobacter tenebrarum]